MREDEIDERVAAIVRRTLAIREEVKLESRTELLGAMPEVDSLSLVALLTAMENEFGFIIDDDEVDAETFMTIGNLSAFVRTKLENAGNRCSPSS